MLMENSHIGLKFIHIFPASKEQTEETKQKKKNDCVRMFAVSSVVNFKSIICAVFVTRAQQ